MYVRMYMYVYTYMYVCMYVCIIPTAPRARFLPVATVIYMSAEVSYAAIALPRQRFRVKA